MLGVVFLLALLALVLALRGTGSSTHNAAAGATGNGGAPALSPSDISDAEKARRAAIAALGPIKTRTGTNAADLYRQALGFYAALTDKEKDMLNHRHDKLDPKAAAALSSKLQPIMDLLRSARDADYVDWGMGPLTNGTDMSWRIRQASSLGSVALWESDYRFQSDPDGAVSDLAALVAMGRSESDSPLGVMFENNFRTAAIQSIAQNAGGISTNASADLAYIADPDATQQSFQNAMNGEVSALQNVQAQYANQPLPPMDGETPPSPAQFAAIVQFMEKTAQALGTNISEPQAQFQQWWSQQLGAAANVYEGTNALQSQEGIIAREQASMVQNAMLSAGIALEQGNQAQFQSIVDPSTGQPFTYSQTATGFQLASPTHFGNRPAVTLSFSTPAVK